MPGLNGIETARAIIELANAAGKTPPYIIGVSGDASAELRDDCIQSGMDDVRKPRVLIFVVEKPLTKPRLQELVRDLEDKSILC